MRVPNLRLRYDSKCGIGHVMRCLTLEMAWARLGGICFRGDPLPGEIVVIDNYYATNEEKYAFMLDGHIVVTITEFPDPVVSDIVVNHNLGAERFIYPRVPLKLSAPRL